MGRVGLLILSISASNQSLMTMEPADRHALAAPRVSAGQLSACPGEPIWAAMTVARAGMALMNGRVRRRKGLIMVRASKRQNLIPDKVYGL